MMNEVDLNNTLALIEEKCGFGVARDIEMLLRSHRPEGREGVGADDDCTDCIPHGVESEFPAGMNPSNERWCACKRGRDAKAAADSTEALDLLGLAATAFRTGFVPPFDWLPRAHALLGLPESNQPLRVGNHARLSPEGSDEASSHNQESVT
jgi:hypothetical protein